MVVRMLKREHAEMYKLKCLASLLNIASGNQYHRQHRRSVKCWYIRACAKKFTSSWYRCRNVVIARHASNISNDFKWYFEIVHFLFICLKAQKSIIAHHAIALASARPSGAYQQACCQSRRQWQKAIIICSFAGGIVGQNGAKIKPAASIK